MQGSSTDLSTRVLDLTRAIADLTVNGNSIVSAGSDLVRWLSRERIDDREFKYCMDLVAKKAFPNSHGLGIRDKLGQTNNSVMKAASLILTVPGSIGRMMAFSTDYCYVVTTVATLMAHHNIPYIVNALCYIVLEPETQADGMRYPYTVRMTRIKPIITKVVESIALNVVNSGFSYSLGELPTELQGVCCHAATEDTFATVITRIENHSSNILIASDVFYADITLWILSHLRGALDVSITGKLLFSRPLGDEKKKIIILVRETCNPGCQERLHAIGERIHVSVNMDGVMKTVLDKDSKIEKVDTVLNSTARRSLYDIRSNIKPKDAGMLNRSTLNHTEMNQICFTGQVIARWLWALPLKPSMVWDKSEERVGWRYSGFQANFIETHNEFLTVGSIMPHWPEVFRSNFGDLPKGTIIFKGEPNNPEICCYTPRPQVTVDDFGGVDELIQCFPPAMTLFELVRPRCGCEDCENRKPLGTGKQGCLRETALTILFTFIGDVIADGFGAKDVSGLTNPHVLKWCLNKLLSEIAFYKLVLWDTWFATVATMVSGCPWDKLQFEIDRGVSSITAIQYGSLVIVAQWADITAEQGISKCFKLVFAEGRLDGIAEDLAVVQSEKPSMAPRLDTNKPHEADFNALDNEAVHVDNYIIGSAGSAYRLLTIVKCGDYVRVVDPSTIMWNHVRSKSPQCPQECSRSSQDISQSNIRAAWSFHEILGKWDNPHGFGTFQNPPTDVTKILDSYLKINVAMGLAPKCCVIKNELCCLECAVKTVNDMITTPTTGIDALHRVICCKVQPGNLVRG